MFKRRTATLLVFLFFCLTGCDKYKAPVAAWRNITFLMTGDSEYNSPVDAQRCEFVIDEMNHVQGTMHPQAGLGPIQNILGVLLAGDVTLNSTTGNSFSTPEFVQFVTQYGLNGNDGELNYPVYEGYGNHDYWTNDPSGVQSWPLYGDKPVLEAIKSRHGSLHYSWDWGMFHMVNLNLYPGTTDQSGNSLAFLQQDLADKVGNSGKPVIIYHHYGFDDFGLQWWTDDERQAYFNVIKNYNVIAIFSGHKHWKVFGTWNGINVYTAPAANGRRAGYPGFLVVEIKNDSLYVTERGCPNYPDDKTWQWSVVDARKVYLPQ